jgi:predicted deacetylase
MFPRDGGGAPSPGLSVAAAQSPETAGVAAQRALCVSIHDAAPATWSDCLRLLEAVRAVSPDLPLTWLLVPRYHGDAASSPAMEQTLSQLLAAGHELALHGYTHLDTAPPRPGWRDHVLRRIYTQGEGEFAALGEEGALHRIDLGLAWFARRGWPVDGFVPPAWLASAGTRLALRQRPFIYTTSVSRFYFLPGERSVWSPSLMYTARNRAGRCLSPPLSHAAALALSLVRAPLIRLALHPADARHPALLRHAQHLMAQLLQQRRGTTKRAFALHYLDDGNGNTAERRASSASCTDSAAAVKAGTVNE